MQPEEATPVEATPEAITRAKHKGRAYQCMPCFHKEGKETIDVRGRIEEHILKNHVSLDEVPYYCRLCLFRCQRREQLFQHVTSYARHREMAIKRGVTDNSQFLVTSLNPHQFTERDYIKLSAEASLRHFLQHQTVQRTSPVAAAVQRMESGQLMEDISRATMDAGYITCTDSPVALHHPTSTQTARENATRQVPISELPSSLVQSLLGLLAGTSTPSTAPMTVTSQTNEVSNQVTGTMETVVGIPEYIPTPKALLRRKGSDGSMWKEASNPEISEGPCKSQVSGSSWRPLDLDASVVSSEQDQPLDLSVKPAIPETLDKMSEQDETNTTLTASTAEQRVECQQQNSTMDTRLVVLAPGSDPAHSPKKITGEVDSAQADQETEDTEEEEPVPTLASQQEAPNGIDDTFGDNQQEENILSQILAPEPMELSSHNKRPSPGVDAPCAKRRKDDAEEPMVSISLIAVNSLVSVLQDLKENERQRIKAEEKMAKALTETTSAMQKLTGAIFRLEEILKTTDREERKREERRQESDRARQMERKREKEEERKRDEKKWEMDRIARGERRRAEEKQKGKERKPALPSVLGDVDKENNARKSKRKE